MVVPAKAPEVAVAAQVPADLRVLRTVAVRLNPVVLALVEPEAVAGTRAVEEAAAVGMAAAVVEQTTTLAVPMLEEEAVDLPLQALLWLPASVIKPEFKLERVK
jgi:hypothetical protein